MSKLKRRPSPAFVISMIALFVALGSGAYAASKVTTKDIKKNAVTANKIKNKAVTGKKIAGNAIGTNKLKNEAVSESKIATGAVTTSKLATGAVRGLFEISEFEETVNVPQFTIGTETASCPPGSIVISGGYDTTVKNAVGTAIGIGVENRPTNNGWRASVFANGVDNQLKVYVRCLEGDSSNG